MTRTLLIVLAAAAVGGFAVGWFVLAPPGGPPNAPPTDPAKPVEAARRFALTAADVPLDRETPAVAADAHGRVLVAWASQSADLERTLWLARSDDGGTTFAEPTAFRMVPVYRYTGTQKGKEVTRTTSVTPRLAAAGDATYLGWTEAVGGGPRVAFYVARTADGGRTFSGPAAAQDADGARPGFTALEAGPDGAAACAWLDHRKEAQLPFFAISDADGRNFSPAALVYVGPPGGGVCPCCDAAVIRTADGAAFVAFRNDVDDDRDIYVARSPGASAAFDPPVAAGPDHWRFEGCPHDGPTLAVAAGRLHVLWMDGHSGRRRVYHATSTLPNLRFTPRELSPGAGEQGHPKLAAAGDVLHAVWDASDRTEPEAPPADPGEHHHPDPAAGGRDVRYAHSSGGDDFGPAVPLDPRPGAFQVNPAVAVGPAGAAYVVWNELTEAGKSVAFVRVPAPSK